MSSKADMLAELRKRLNDVFTLRQQGSTYPRLSRAQGYVDGYMRVLLDGNLATKEELLELVANERRSTSGPATRELVQSEAEFAA